MRWEVAGVKVLPAEVEAVIPAGFGPGVAGLRVPWDELCEAGGAVNGALNGIEVLRNADRLLPQHIVVSFRGL
jgi:hypothetical protein